MPLLCVQFMAEQLEKRVVIPDKGKERNCKLIAKKWRKIGIALAALECLLLVAFMEKKQTEASGQTEQSFRYAISINTIEYTGTYTGETKGGKPHGEGTFVTDSKAPKSFTYAGQFEEGVFEGNGEKIYPNGDCLKGKFTNNNPTGKMMLFHQDGTYTVIRYSATIPYGPRITCSESGNVIDKDFYYDGLTHSDWKEEAQTIEYRELYQNSEKYYGKVLMLNCEVRNVYENISECIFKVTDEDGNIYWGSYKNTKQQQFNQSVMPTLKTGDHLELYAFFRGISNYVCKNDVRDSNYSFPELTPIVGTTQDFSLNYSKLSGEYEEVLRYPFNYYNVMTNISGKVENVLYTDNSKYIKIVDTQNDIYYCSIDDIYDDIEIPIPGDSIKVRAYYMGLYKEHDNESDSDATGIYVLLKASSVKFLD